MPGLRLTTAQAERLCSADAMISASALHALVSAGFLSPLPDGTYGRTDLLTSGPGHSAGGVRVARVPSPWRRILCLVDLDDEGGQALSAEGRSALRYATTLAVAHRARVTALRVIPPPSSGAAVASATEELRKGIFGDRLRGLIDVQASAGAPNEALARVAKDVGADLIVIGHSGRGDGDSWSGLSATLRKAPCPVLIVHPSGRAAVA